MVEKFQAIIIFTVSAGCQPDIFDAYKLVISGRISMYNTVVRMIIIFLTMIREGIYTEMVR